MIRSPPLSEGLTLLAGTPYFPNLNGAILCVEISEEEPSWWADRDLTQLRLLGAFEKASALIIGRTHPDSGFTEEDPLEEMLLTVAGNLDLPLAIGFDFGHTGPMFTLPIGVRAAVDFTGEQPKLELLGSGVSETT